MARNYALNTQDSQSGNFPLPQPILFTLPRRVQDSSNHWTNSAVSLSLEDAIKLERDTTEQAKCELWFRERKPRITASLFGEILYESDSKRDLLEKLCNFKPFSSLATDYGNRFEDVARQRYTERTGRRVHPCGLVVQPVIPFLGASPDGKLFCSRDGRGILEVKCPYTVRDMTIQEAVITMERNRYFCLERRHDGVTSLKRDHKYYCQIQGQLMLAGVKFCDFVVFTQRDVLIERIYADYPFMKEMLEKLTLFYIQYFKNYGKN